MGNVAEWSKALELGTIYIQSERARVRTPPLSLVIILLTKMTIFNKCQTVFVGQLVFINKVCTPNILYVPDYYASMIVKCRC